MYGVDPSMAKDNPAYDENLKYLNNYLKRLSKRWRCRTGS